MLDFQKEIVDLISRLNLEDKLDKSLWTTTWNYENCCYMCLWLITDIKCTLPENLHNRMILGQQNGWTKTYVRISKRDN